MHTIQHAAATGGASGRAVDRLLVKAKQPWWLPHPVIAVVLMVLTGAVLGYGMSTGRGWLVNQALMAMIGGATMLLAGLVGEQRLRRYWHALAYRRDCPWVARGWWQPVLIARHYLLYTAGGHPRQVWRLAAVPVLAAAFTFVFAHVHFWAVAAGHRNLFLATLALSAFAAILAVTSAGAAFVDVAGKPAKRWIAYLGLLVAATVPAAGVALARGDSNMVVFFSGAATAAAAIAFGVASARAVQRKARNGM
jgi:hypothetical protein